MTSTLKFDFYHLLFSTSSIDSSKLYIAQTGQPIFNTTGFINRLNSAFIQHYLEKRNFACLLDRLSTCRSFEEKKHLNIFLEIFFIKITFALIFNE